MKKIYFLFILSSLILFSGCDIKLTTVPNAKEIKIENNEIPAETVLNNIIAEKNAPISEEPAVPAFFGKKVFFMHHSTGEIYWNSGMRSALYNHSYIGDAPWWDGETNPQDFYGEFKSKWDLLKNYDIIIFKSCFPASDITSDEMLADYKNWYKRLYEIYSAHPDKLFVPMSTPPLLENHTTVSAARRAVQFENWLLNEYKNGYAGKNLAPFALHALLDNSSGFLDERYVVSPDDDHPNNYSGPVVGEAMWKHLNSVLEN